MSDNMVLAVPFTMETFDLKQAAESAVPTPLPMHFQVLTPKSSLIEEIYICQADHGHSHKDLLIMWSATCPQHQILLLGFFGKTRLFTKHVCRQLMSWFQIPSHPSRTHRRRESIVEQWRRRRRGWWRSWRRRTLGAAHGKHIQVLAAKGSFEEVIYICQADSGLQQEAWLYAVHVQYLLSPLFRVS